jgi:hypothetical protein
MRSQPSDQYPNVPRVKILLVLDLSNPTFRAYVATNFGHFVKIFGHFSMLSAPPLCPPSDDSAPHIDESWGTPAAGQLINSISINSKLHSDWCIGNILRVREY